MASVSVRGVSKSFGSTPIIDGISLDICDGEFLTLLGPSGCGKSTLLRIIAGLERQDCGTIEVAGSKVDHLRPKRRDVAMVFQSYALYPHLTVSENMALPLRMRRLSALQRLPVIGALLPNTHSVSAEIKTEVARAAKALGIDHLLARKPGQLSGGQRQRVAVGRAMVRHPAVFLMDEPLSNLDAKLRVQMRGEIKELHRRIGVTFVYVTHDQTEAMTMSDRIAVMLDGQLAQVASPQQIYTSPADRRVAELIGAPKINLLEATPRGEGLLAVAGSTLALDSKLDGGNNITLGIRPESLQFAERAGLNTLTGRLRYVEHVGADLFAHVDVPGSSEPLVARLPVELASSLQSDQSVHLRVRREQALLFSADGRRLSEGDDQFTQLRSCAG
ncbi:ABC transporter ATP-binding protein [Bradyrhizobium iriomotense]|uniref:ABC transporter ATP-binding protein n=1 Tax=Bradyrhizobium iriomotense TaxID=441950 RepID=A0ABQ6BFS5_9BRAD|nr:ABC transporter ATP-binding protein [Bradyrhizobium iriomotense]GLR91007.1 ABC transporter ATP-binding protein [Bradyrhizobium iriomotense]